MLEDALSYPTNGESGLARLLVGGTLGFFGFLVLPSLALWGYLIRAMTASSRDESEPPEFTDWGGLMMDGLKGAVVGVAYGLVPVALLVVSFGTLSAGTSAGPDASGLLAGVGSLGLVAVSVTMFVMQYALPAAVINFGREGHVGAAFDSDTLLPVLTSREYVVAALLTFAVALVGGIAFTVFAVVTLGLGYLVAPFFYFWLYLAASHMFGTAFGDAVETDYADRRDVQFS